MEDPVSSEKETQQTEEEKGAGCGVCMITPDTDGVFGFKSYDYKYLCMPSMPWSKGGVEPPMFLSKDAVLPLLLSLVMGLQHALAMVAGIATSGGLLIAGDACFAWQSDPDMCDAKSYMVSAAWITSGILTIIQVFRAKIFNTGYYLGTGLISVMGTSFTFLPIARDMVIGEIKNPSDSNDESPGMTGYGKFLGTCMVAALLEIAIAMLPPKVINRLFPPVVTGSAVMLIGGGLISSGIKYVGGGVFCAENNESKQASIGFGPQLCNENGDVVLGFGAPEYIGLAFSVIAMSTFLQFFGSPFLKSTFLFWGLMFGTLISAIVTYEAEAGDKTLCTAEPDNFCAGGFADAVEGREYSYWNSERIDDAPTFTFLWATTFPLGFDGAYLLPLLIGFFISSAETVGDIGMSCIASRIPSEGPDFDSRVQGGLLADGINSLVACLFTSPPNTTFSQNNGVIALTGCASRAAGFACAFWLILFGVFGKIGAAFSSIPICVVGGLVLQCFTMVFVSGMVMATKDITRRNSFILMLALGIGMGVAMEPHLFEGGGGFSFYSQNLAHNIGFWPKSKTCDVFPTSDVTITSAYCTAGNGYVFDTDDESACAGIGGNFTESVTSSVEVKTCASNNGYCCLEYDETEKSIRTTVIMILKTPYCIGFLIALFLNLLLPEDKDPKLEDDGSKYIDGQLNDAEEKDMKANVEMGALQVTGALLE
eukprot:CAMPEP_0185767660 /NCGR_PEP_ID=MMETSP1174-20130828/45475_1 /TAXON_ID=35687 /ORGANISM="Dictyocha speculum, Strain CCMP1381" /LENGTH=708 /DNA_ID=CAMNT_0028451987 /DNA_START=21 /DNA_END=2147 /DNA_ORIENTATION=-